MLTKVNDKLGWLRDDEPSTELQSRFQRRMYLFGACFMLACLPVFTYMTANYNNKPNGWLFVSLVVLGVLVSWLIPKQRNGYLHAMRVLHSFTFLGMLGPALVHVTTDSPFYWWLAAFPVITLLSGLTKLGFAQGVVLFVYTIYSVASPDKHLPQAGLEIRNPVAAVLSTIYIWTYLFYAIRWREKLQCELVSAQKEALEAANAKSLFLASMSHEIRTPLYGVIGAVELLRRGKATSAQRNQLLAMQEQSAKALLALINDVLDWSKLEAGRLELTVEPTDLRTVIFEANELYAVTAFDKGLEITSSCDHDVPLTVRCDGCRVRQVVNNLVSNAVKFTAKGGVHIHASVVTDNSESPAGSYWLRIEVSDTGVGINPARLAALFDPFTQADATISRKHGGTGLGLSICKELATLMGGRVDATSVPGQGSAFALMIPLDQQDVVPTHNASPNLRVDVLVVCANPGLIRHVLSLSQEVNIAPQIVSTLPDTVESAQASYILIDSAMLTGHPQAKQFVDSLVLQGKRVAVMAPLNADVVFGTIGDGILYKPLGRPAFTQFLQATPDSPSTSESTANNPIERIHSDRRILVCEDNPVNQILVQQMLDELGLQCVVASNGHDALRHLQNERFGLVLMDIQMPDLDGIEATKRWRLMEPMETPGVRVPIIAITANPELDQRVAYQEIGLDRILPKPFVLGDLARTIRLYLESAKADTVTS